MGFAIIDNSTAELLCGQSEIENLSDILSQYQIKELLIPEGQKEFISNKLKVLYLNNNQLTSIPDGIFDNLRELKVLQLSSNQL